MDPTLVLEALRMGADGVLIAGCHPGDCHYHKGNFMMEKRFYYLKEAVKNVGIEPERVRLEWVSASEGGKWAALVREMVEEIRQLGPSPFRRLQIPKKTDAMIDAFKSQRLRWVVGRSQIKVEIDEGKYRQTVDAIMHDETERHMITGALKGKGPLTAEELAHLTGLQPRKIVQHLIALRRDGKVNEAGEKNSQYLYQLSRSLITLHFFYALRMNVAWKVMIVKVDFAFFDINFDMIMNRGSVQKVAIVFFS